MSTRLFNVYFFLRYLFQLIYTVRDNFNPKYTAVVFDVAQNKPVVLPADSSLVYFSKKGTWVILKKDEWAQKMKGSNSKSQCHNVFKSILC